MLPKNRLFTMLLNGSSPESNNRSNNFMGFKLNDNDTHPEYKLFKSQVAKVNSCYLGTDAMAKRLKRLPHEALEDYRERQQSVIVENFIKRSITKITGRIMRKGVEVDKRYDAIIPNIEALAKELGTEYTREGAVGILVDRPLEGGDPYISVYTREQILDWTYENGELTSVSIVTPVRVGNVYEAEYRTITSDGTHTVQLGNDGDVTTIQTSFTQMPFVLINSSTSPLFNDVASVQLNHMNQRSLLDSYQEKAGSPYLLTKGLGIDSNNQLELSIHSTINTDNTEASVEWIETSGSSIPNLAQDLKDKAEYANSLALTAGEGIVTKTATQSSAENAEQNALLTAVAETVEHMLNKVLGLFVENPVPDAIKINKDFTDDSSKMTSIIGQLNGSVTSGNLSKETYIKALVKADVIEVDSVDEELKRIDEESAVIEAQLEEAINDKQKPTEPTE